ncbi:hypothetical protein DFQ26_000203 [Actinomortierella ambigua]|nr:hypothetical protein DFQ26_000203 [Actinomortierella ambigua]
MTRRLSVLATFLLLAILQVCAAFRTPVGRFKLSIKDMYLDAEEPYHGTLVVLKPGTTSTIWDLAPDGAILHSESGYFLGYTEEEEYARLVMTRRPVKWRTETLEKGLQISAPDCELVVGMLPFRIDPPLVGLTMQDKEGSQTWKLERPQELDATPFVPEGNFHFQLENGHYLGVFIQQRPPSPVFLLDSPSPSTVWEVKNEGSKGLVSIRNLETDAYLSYYPDDPHNRLLIGFEKSLFRILTIEGGAVQIITGLVDAPPKAVAEMPRDRPGPPLAGLTEIRKDRNQLWKLLPVQDLDDAPRQYRLPFRRLRFW